LAAQALIQRRTFPQALRLYEDLLARTTEPVKRAQIEKIRDSVNQQQELAVANARRCPVITQEITQPVIVKPKLAALPEDWSWDAKTQPGEEQ